MIGIASAELPNLVCALTRIVFVQVAHVSGHAPPVDAARKAALVLDSVAEERGAGRHRLMVDIPVQGEVIEKIRLAIHSKLHGFKMLPEERDEVLVFSQPALPAAGR
jgi:hypothetical protein